MIRPREWFISIGPLAPKKAREWAAYLREQHRGRLDIALIDDRCWYARAFDEDSVQGLLAGLAASHGGETVADQDLEVVGGLIDDMETWLAYGFIPPEKEEVGHSCQLPPGVVAPVSPLDEFMADHWTEYSRRRLLNALENAKTGQYHFAYDEFSVWLDADAGTVTITDDSEGERQIVISLREFSVLAQESPAMPRPRLSEDDRYWFVSVGPLDFYGVVELVSRWREQYRGIFGVDLNFDCGWYVRAFDQNSVRCALAALRSTLADRSISWEARSLYMALESGMDSWITREFDPRFCADSEPRTQQFPRRRRLRSGHAEIG